MVLPNRPFARRYGQLTYVRVYSGKVKKGDYIVNMSNSKKVGAPLALF